jgi:hypothetical protein
MHPQPSKNPKILLNQLKWEIINKSLTIFYLNGWVIFSREREKISRLGMILQIIQRKL